MTRFNQVVLNKMANTVEVGAGLTWDDVYQKLDGTGFNVVGGRVSGVGVAGFTLGGGERSSFSTVFCSSFTNHKPRLFLEVESVWAYD